MRDFARNFLAVATFVVAMTAMVFNYAEFAQTKTRLARSEFSLPTPSDTQIDSAIARMLRAGRSSEVDAFYAEQLGDPGQVEVLVTDSLIRHEHVDVVMAIARWNYALESGEKIGGILEGESYTPTEDIAETMDLGAVVKAPDMRHADFAFTVLEFKADLDRRFAQRFADAINW